MCRMDAQLILSPSAWAVDADHDNKKDPYGGMWIENYTKIAQIYDIGIIGVSNVGWITSGGWKGRKCIGNSIAVGPGGELIKMCDYGEDAEEVFIIEMDVIDKGLTGTNYSMLTNFDKTL